MKFQARCFDESLAKELDDVVRGEVVKFEEGAIGPGGGCQVSRRRNLSGICIRPVFHIAEEPKESSSSSS